MPTLQEQFGEIDIYLFDQLLKGRITPGMRIFDAGCGGGRNIHYFLREGYEVFGADSSAEAVAHVRTMAQRWPASNFRAERLEQMSFPDHFADVVICSAVLHFASHHAQFEAMLVGAWRVLRPGGLFFCRLASSIGIEDQVEAVGGGRFQLMDGSERYLVDVGILQSRTEQLGGRLADPIKTTVVQDLRAMTTWVLVKGHGSTPQVR